jgi:hypothetical protein
MNYLFYQAGSDIFQSICNISTVIEKASIRLSYQDVLLIYNIYKNQIDDYTNLYLPQKEELRRERKDSSELGIDLEEQEQDITIHKP